MTELNIYDIQNKIGYNFKNPILLKQAFTSPSVSEATQHRTQNYQILEFIGDSVLGLAVVKLLAHEFCTIDNDGQMVCKTNEGKLTIRKQELTKNETLAHCSNVLGLDKYMERAYGHHSFDYKNKKGDLIEAILGAVAFDCNWNMDVFCAVIKNILKYKNIQINYTEKLENLCRKKKLGEPLYRIYRKGNTCGCCVSIQNLDRVFRSEDESELNANNNACKEAYNYLKNHKKHQIMASNIDTVSKLQHMHQIKEIERPVYEFEKIPSGWRCTVSLPDCEYEFCTEGSNKKVAKQLAAESLLNYLINANFGDTDVIIDDEKVVRGKGLLKLIMSKYYQLNKVA